MVGRVARSVDRVAREAPLYPFLLAAYPIVLLYGQNLTDVLPEDVVPALVVALTATAVALVGVGWLWHDVRRAALVVTALIVPVLLFERIYRGARPVVGSRSELLAISIVGVVVAALIARRLGRALASVTYALNVSAVILVMLALAPVAMSLTAAATGPSYDARATGDPAATLRPIGRDIWYLVFDRYGSARSIDIGFGITDDDLLPWLEEEGFQVLQRAHANYVRTALSLASTLNMRRLDGLAASLGPEDTDYGPLDRMLRSNEVARTLTRAGYHYVHVGSTFLQTRDAVEAERVLVPDYGSFASTALWLTAVPFIADRLGLSPRETVATHHRDAAEFEFRQLAALRDERGPLFVFGHILLPHPPYVFLANGRFAPRQATYESQMRYLNARIRDLVAPLLARPEEERPIIILQADEGPYPDAYQAERDAFEWDAATPAEVEMKFGIFDAMYLPGPEGAAPLPQTMTSVNTFRTIFRRYFGLDLPDLPDRSFVSSERHPYDFVDITDKLERRPGYRRAFSHLHPC